MEFIEPSTSTPSKAKKRKRAKKITSDDDDDDEDFDIKKQNSDLDFDDEEEDAEEQEEMNSWDKDLMGDEKDRKKLKAMNELDREIILAERRKKLDARKESIALKNRLDSQSRQSTKMTEKERKGQSLENLRRKRKEKANAGRRGGPSIQEESDRRKGDDFVEDDEGERSDPYGDESDIYSDMSDNEAAKKKELRKAEREKKEEMEKDVTLQEALKIQITRDKAEAWLYRPDFERVVQGCFARVSLGTVKPGTSEVAYRCVVIENLKEYKKKYLLNKTYTKTSIEVSHGNSKKELNMDMLSNQPISEQDWNRFVIIHKTDKKPLPTIGFVVDKLEAIKASDNHTITTEEFNAMLAKKKSLANNSSVNYALEKVRLNAALDSARNEELWDKVEEIRRAIIDLGEAALLEKSSKQDSTMAQLAELNQKNRIAGMNEIKEAERIALLAKRQKGVNQADPFARRKTAPTHNVSSTAAVLEAQAAMEAIQDVEASKSTVSRSASSMENLPESDDDDIFAQVDVSLLEEDLKSAL